MGIYILTAPPRYGKTSLMTHWANEVAFNRGRTRLMQAEIQNKIDSGFASLKTIPNNCVSANYALTMRQFGYSPRQNRRINPYRLGFDNPYVKTHFNLPYEFICITEAQKYFNSRMAQYYPDWQSRWFEQSGHNYLDILMDTQRVGLIDPNIRDLAKVIEVVRLDIEKDSFGQPAHLEWKIRYFDNNGLWDKYVADGKRGNLLFDEMKIEANYNVFTSYDSRSCKPYFYQGHLNQDFDYEISEVPEENFDGYVSFLKKYDKEYPDKFHIKRSSKAA